MANLVRYDLSTDELVPVTQQWIDDMQKVLGRFGNARRIARDVLEDGGAPAHIMIKLHEFLAAWKSEFQQKEDHDAKSQQEAGPHDGSSCAQPEVRQESGDSSEGCEGIQQGRSKSEAPGAKGQVAVAYAVTVDGFIAIKHKVIRNPMSPFIVWMSEAQWTKLANCASEQGLFYIPRTDTIDSPAVLRALVANI